MPPGHAVTGTPRVGGFGPTLATCEDGRVHLSPGDRVALLVPGSVAYVELVLALLRRGVFPIPMDPRLTQAERRPLFADLEPHHVVTDPAEVPALLDELGPGDGVPLGRPIHVTSGTTGRPKGVYSGLLDETAAAALVREEQELWGFDADDVNLV